MDYLVRCVSPQDTVVRHEVLQADDEQALRGALAARGVVVLDVRPARRRRPAASRARSRGDYGLFCREVRTLIRAGMTVVEAVDTLSARNGARGGSTLVDALRERLQQGQSLSHALSQLPDAPAVLVAAVRAGERTSNLPEALDDYLRFDDLIQRLRRKVISAAIYPALVTTLGIGISLFLLIVVMPSFSRMYQNLKARSGTRSMWMIDFSQWVSQHRGMTLALLGALVLLAAWWVRSGAAVRFAERVAVATPWIRSRVEDFQLAMLYQALALLLKGGYPMAQAIEIGGQAALGRQLAQALREAHGRILEGGLVSQSLAGAGLCDEVGRRLMAAAERNGDFHLAADVVARMHGERFELFVERLTRIVEPLLLLGVAVLVGGIVVAMYMPVFDMATRLR
jgi:general secretion pathway protein F